MQQLIIKIFKIIIFKLHFKIAIINVLNLLAISIKQQFRWYFKITLKNEGTIYCD